MEAKSLRSVTAEVLSWTVVPKTPPWKTKDVESNAAYEAGLAGLMKIGFCTPKRTPPIAMILVSNRFSTNQPNPNLV
jgi:hypothetical protein